MHDTTNGSVFILYRLEIVFKSLRLKWRIRTFSIGNWSSWSFYSGELSVTETPGWF